MPASSCAIGVPARSPCPCSEAVADEAQVGLDLLHRRPVRLKADHAIADLPERFEAPVVIVERPIVQIAADQASAAGDGTAGDGHVEPVDGGLAHLGADPELARHRQRHIVQLGRQLHARAAAIALEPQPATHVGAVVLPCTRSAGVATCQPAPSRQPTILPASWISCTTPKPVGQSKRSVASGAGSSSTPCASPSMVPRRPLMPGALPTGKTPAPRSGPARAVRRPARRRPAGRPRAAAVWTGSASAARPATTARSGRPLRSGPRHPHACPSPRSGARRQCSARPGAAVAPPGPGAVAARPRASRHRWPASAHAPAAVPR